jgi:SRSO17 transposase
MSHLPRRNGWTIAKLIGDKTPDRTQRLLNRACWDEAAAMSAVRRFAVTGLDETGQEKHGTATAGVQRQHTGCAGGVENGISTVHLSYIREGTGHALTSPTQSGR